MEHSITGESSWSMDSFELPDHDCDTTMRNFPGYMESTFYDMEDIREGDWSGSTDTDMPTEDHKYVGKTTDHSRSKGKDNPYSKVNQTMGKSRSYPKTSSPRVKDPNKKPKRIGNPLRGSKTKR